MKSVGQVMRIGVDYTSALHQRAGIGRYTRGIIGALGDLDHENHYILVVPRDVGDMPSLPPTMHLHRLPLTERALIITWHRLRLPLYVDIFTGPIDVFHSPDFVLPPVCRGKTLVTVHDLSFMHYPECAPPSLVDYLNTVVPRSVRRADLILADSVWTRQDIVNLLGIPEDRIVVVPAGVGAEYHPIDDQSLLDRVRKRYNLPQRFILHVGTLEPRKNLKRLLEAFAAISAQEPETYLVLVGSKGWLYEDLFATIQRLSLEERVLFLGYVPEDDLPVVYNLCTVFAYPSLYEGFGLPPLEALACGATVVCSNSSSLPEVVGDAALMVDPMNIDALATTLKRALSDKHLRRDLRMRGLKRARLFSWQAAALRLLEAYRLCALG